MAFRTLSIRFPLTAFSHFPFDWGFFTLGDGSSLHNFAPDSEVSSSHRLIKLGCLQSCATRLSIVSKSDKATTQSEAAQNPVIPTCTIIRGLFRWVFQLLTRELRSRCTSKSWTSRSFCNGRIATSRSQLGNLLAQTLTLMSSARQLTLISQHL